MFQLQMIAQSETEERIGRFIIESLDENGYLYQGKWIKSNGETKTILP